MTPLYTPAQVRSADEATIAAGVPSLDLMERAAGHLARAVLAVAGRSYGVRVALVCGKGNNGGDGIAAARLLRRAGAWPVVVLVVPPDELSGDAAVQLERWRGVGGRVTTDLAEGLTRADVMVDCLLGTGTSGAPRPPYDAAITAINGNPAPVVACDMPSGINAQTGAVHTEAVTADLTLSLGAHKVGLALAPARRFVGELRTGPIGIDGALDPPVAHLIDIDHVRQLLPAPDADGDKRGRGVVVIVAGSSNMSGAAVLAARGALAGGAGLVTVATTSLARHVVAPNVPEAMTIALPDDDPAYAFDLIAAACERADAVVIGPGLGHENPQVELVRRCVGDLRVPMVLDADGLNAFRDDAAALAAHASPDLVLTPHRSELTRICRPDNPDDFWTRRITTVPELARAWNATIVAKGPGTVIAAPGGRVWVDREGTAALATGGSGDVLSGLVGAVVAAAAARGSAGASETDDEVATLSVRVAAAVALHGRAGRIAADRSHLGSVTSLDIARSVPAAFRDAFGRST